MENTVTLRPLRIDDATQVAALANNAKISRNMRDGFPHPYSMKNAEDFIAYTRKSDPVTIFAIECDGAYVGNVGLHPCEDVYRMSAEIGYFIGEPFWNKGIATKAISLAVEFGFDSLGLNRIHAGVFSFNEASVRVLEKCGFQREGVSREAVFKEGAFYDEIRFAILSADWK